MRMNLIRYLKSLKNCSISSMNDFNRVSHISGGLLFRWYHCSTFVTCQIIFPPHVMFICQNSVVQSCLLLHVQRNQIWGEGGVYLDVIFVVKIIVQNSEFHFSEPECV